VVLAGDARLPEKLRREELIPLGSRIRTRLATEAASREELLACLQHLVGAAGNACLMSTALMHTLCDHAVGNYRILTTMAAELLAVAAHRDLPQLDEKLYLEVFSPPETAAPRRASARRRPPTGVPSCTLPPSAPLSWPELPDEAAVALQSVLHDFVMLFEPHYLGQIERH